MWTRRETSSIVIFHTHTKCLVKRRHTSSLSARTNKLELVFRKKWTESWEIVKNKLTKMFDSRSLCVFQTFFALETILFSRIDILPLLANARYWRPNKGKEKRNFQHKMKQVLIITKIRYSTQQSFWISGGKKSMSVFSFRIRNNFSCCSHLSICSYLYYSNWQIMQLQATLKGKRSKKKSFFLPWRKKSSQKTQKQCPTGSEMQLHGTFGRWRCK